MPQNSSVRKIGAAEKTLLEFSGAKALAYYNSFGLAESQSRAISITLSGLFPIIGMAGFDWTAAAMLIFMIFDAVVTVLADIIRYLFVKKIVAASHKADFDASQILLISDGLEDGSGTMADRGNTCPYPGTILFFGGVSSIFLVPIIAAAAEQIGLGAFKEVLSDKTFIIMSLLDAAWRLLSAITEVVRARISLDKESYVFMDSGGVALLYAGLLILVWLPIKFGVTGLYLMFFTLYFIRLAFGIFAYFWSAKAVKVLARRVREKDFSLAGKRVLK
jgi:hypothetical protein